MINNNEVSCLFNYHIVLFSKWVDCTTVAISQRYSIAKYKNKEISLIYNWVNYLLFVELGVR